MIIKSVIFRSPALKILAILWMCVVFPRSVWSEESRTQRHVLDNGMVVLITAMPKSPTVSIYALVKTGSSTEGQYLGTGISHFVEHMLFKGTKKRPVGTIPSEVKALGGTINASTSYDHTIYTLDVPSASFLQGLDIISDMVTGSVFDPVEVQKEREVIFGEMRMINDRPERKLGDLISRSVYLRHPYRHPIIGYVPLFGQITQDQLVDYYKRHYIPNNIVLSIAGNVRDQDVLSLVTEKFKDFKPRAYQDRNLSVEPIQIASRRFEQEYPSQITRLAMAYQGVDLLNPDLFALDVLAMILGQGESSRLYQDVLKSRQLVNSISASNYTPIDQGVFEVVMEFEQGDVDGIVAVVRQNIEEIKKRGVKPEELEKARRQVLSALIFGRQTSPSVAYNAAVNEAMAGDYDFDSKYLAGIRKLTPQDIRRAAQKYLVDDRLSVVVLKPVDVTEKTSSEQIELKDSEIEKEGLANGLTLLLKEDRAHPIATIFVTMRAGSREEPSDQSGLNQLTADLWSQAAGRWDSKQFAQMVEARGASLTSSGGFNTMSLNINFLSEDMPFALDLIESIIKDPAFAPEDFDNQKKLNLAGIREQDDSLLQTGMNHLRKMLFLTHPMREDISGSIEGLTHVRRNDVIEFYNKLLTPDHMVIGVYGDIKKDLVLTELKKRFGALSKKNVTLSVVHEDQPQTRQNETVTMDKQQAAVIVGFHAPDIYDADRYGMEAISTILGSSLSGRLFVKIREELGDAYTLGAFYSPNLDAGMMLFYVLTNEAQVERVQSILLKEIRDLADVPVPADELKSTQVKLKSEFAEDIQTVRGLANITALDELYGLGYNDHKNYDAKIDKVSVQDIQRIAKKYLDPARAATVVIKPGSPQKK